MNQLAELEYLKQQIVQQHGVPKHDIARILQQQQLEELIWKALKAGVELGRRER